MPTPRPAPLARLLAASRAPLGALLTAGALAAGVRISRPAHAHAEQAQGAASRPGSAALRPQTPPERQDAPIRWPSPDLAPPLSACARGPVAVSDLTQTNGFLRWQSPAVPEYHEFYFTRAIYTDYGRGFGGYGGRGYFRAAELGDRGPAWSIDYSNADRHMVQVTRRLSNIDACGWEHPASLADPELRRYPFLYSLEWGNAKLTDAEVKGLRDYLDAGGFLMIDDFWGTYEWQNFEQQMKRVLPGKQIVELPRTDLLFHIHYTVEGDILQVPNAGNARAIEEGDPRATTSEKDGFVPHVRGIYDNTGRLMVVINWNTDLGDALEWAESPYYPLRYSTFASEMFLNMIMYSMTR
jgi:hypothetical protein